MVVFMYVGAARHDVVVHVLQTGIIIMNADGGA